MKRLLLLIVALILYGSLYPWQFHWWRTTESPLDVLLRSWPERIDRFELRDIALNIPLYFPVGLLAYLAVARRNSRALAAAAGVALGAALSISIELIQVYVPGRISSIVDVACNVTGAALGAAAGLMFHDDITALVRKRRHRLAAGAILLLACFGTCYLFPFMPDISHHKLRQLAWALSNSPFSPIEVWANAAEWIAALAAFSAVAHRSLRWWAALPIVMLAARIPVVNRVITPNEIAGAVLAAALWLAIPDRWRLPGALWILASALVLRELAPFRLVARAEPFRWIPFGPTLEAEPISAAVIIARKAFDYGALVWLFRQSGVRYRWAGLLVAVILFAFELLQTHLPGRTPEITESVVTLLMALMLWLCDRTALL